MKKIMLAIVLAATASTGAHAVIVESNFSNEALWLGASNLLDGSTLRFTSATASANFAVGGDTDLGLTFTGVANFNLYAGPVVRLTLDLSDGVRQGVNGAGGTLFTAGTVTSEIYGSTGRVFFEVIDAAVKNIPFLSAQDGHIATCAVAQCTAGLVIDDAGSGSFTSWNGVFYDPTWNNAIVVFPIADTLGLFISGTVSASSVPVPAAAWLFGSALVGLAGIRRSKQ